MKGWLQTHTHLLTVTHSTQHDEENRKSRLVGQGKDSVIREERKKKPHEECEGNHSAQDTEWCAASHQTALEQHLGRQPLTTPIFFTAEEVTQYGISLSGHLWVSCVPSPFLVHPQPARCTVERWETESFDAVQGLLSDSQNTGVVSAPV